VEINAKSRVIITYVIRQSVLLHGKSVSMRWISRIRTFAGQSLGIFYLYYSRNDHVLFDQLHRAQVFSELIYGQVII